MPMLLSFPGTGAVLGTGSSGWSTPLHLHALLADAPGKAGRDRQGEHRPHHRGVSLMLLQSFGLRQSVSAPMLASTGHPILPLTYLTEHRHCAHRHRHQLTARTSPPAPLPRSTSCVAQWHAGSSSVLRDGALLVLYNTASWRPTPECSGQQSSALAAWEWDGPRAVKWAVDLSA